MRIVSVTLLCYKDFFPRYTIRTIYWFDFSSFGIVAISFLIFYLYYALFSLYFFQSIRMRGKSITLELKLNIFRWWEENCGYKKCSWFNWLINSQDNSWTWWKLNNIKMILFFFNLFSLFNRAMSGSLAIVDFCHYHPGCSFFSWFYSFYSHFINNFEVYFGFRTNEIFNLLELSNTLRGISFHIMLL